MAVIWTGSPENMEKLLLPGIASYFDEAVRQKLQEVADQAVKEVKAEFCNMVVSKITSIKHFADNRIELIVTLDDRTTHGKERPQEA